jgi:hypothetical protein
MGGAALGLDEGSLQIAGARGNCVDLRLQDGEARAATAEFSQILCARFDQRFSSLLDPPLFNGELGPQLVPFGRHFGH